MLALAAAFFIAGCETATTSRGTVPPVQGQTRRSAPIITEYPTGRKLRGPLFLTFGSDGDIYFTSNGPRIGRMTTSGVVTAYRYKPSRPTLESTFDITLGPDKNIWFSDYYGETVGTIRNGAIKTFQIFASTPGGYGYTAGIINGPNHRLWIVRPGSAYEVIDEMTTQPKVIATYIPRGYDCYGDMLTSTPDGTLWEGRSVHCPTIVRITPDKQGRKIREFPLPYGSQATGLTSMPDGSVWFANCPLNEIGRTVTGTPITWFPTPDHPDKIVAAPDGTLWFSEPYVGRIAHMTTAGAITEYTIPDARPDNQSSLQTLGLALGKDGSVWFTEPQLNKIGHLIP